MNQLNNNFNNTFIYIELEKDFIIDKDAKDGKISNYYLNVVLNE